jgi:predicted secreted protein
MKFTSILAIFALFWALSLFFVLPFRLKSGDGPEAYVPGQAAGAPPRFSFGRTCLWTTVVAAVLFGIFYLNYVFGWVGVEVFDLFSSPDRRV